MLTISIRYMLQARWIDSYFGANRWRSAGGYSTAVPRNNASNPYSLVTRRSDLASIELKCPRKYYHLHVLASDVTVSELEISPLVVPSAFFPLMLKRFPCDPACDPGGPQFNGTQRAKL